MIRRLLPTLILLLGLSCSPKDTVKLSDVNLIEVHGHYSVDYREDKETAEFFAQFRQGGTGGLTIQLTEPSEISVDGEKLQEKRSPQVGTYYRLEKQISWLKPAYTFFWKLPDASVIPFPVEMPQPVAVVSPGEGSVHSRLENLEIGFSGEPARAGRTVSVSLEGQDLSLGNQVTVTATTEAPSNTLWIPVENLRKFPKGKARLFVYRELKSEPQRSLRQFGGFVRSMYRSKPIEITID